MKENKLIPVDLKFENLITQLGLVMDQLFDDGYDGMAAIVKEAIINLRSQEIGTKAQASNKRYETALNVFNEYMTDLHNGYKFGFEGWLAERLNASHNS